MCTIYREMTAAEFPRDVKRVASDLTPVAFVVGDASDEELQAVCREHLVPYKIPVAFERVASIPRSEVGKVLRRQLAESWKG